MNIRKKGSCSSWTWLSSRTSWGRNHRCIRADGREHLFQLRAAVGNKWNRDAIYSLDLQSFFVVPHFLLGFESQPPTLIRRCLEQIFELNRCILALLSQIPKLLAFGCWLAKQLRAN